MKLALRSLWRAAAACFLGLVSSGWSPESISQNRDPLGDAIAGGRYQEALQIAEARLKVQPRDPALCVARGLALEGLGRGSEALDSFDRALRLAPSYLPALKAAAQSAYRSRHPRTDSYLKQILKVDPASEVAHAMGAVLAYEAKDCGLAVNHFERCKRQIAGNELALTQYSYCLVKLGRASEAAGLLRPLLIANPANRLVRYNYAVSLLEAKRPTEAIAILKPVTEGETADAGALNLRAAAEAGSGQLEAALASLRRASKIAPRNEQNYLDFAALCLEHENHELAEEVLTTGLANLSNSARLFSMRGMVRTLRGRGEAAASDFEEASRLSPDRAFGAIGHTLLLRQKNQLAEAITVIRERLKASPEDPTLNYLAADLLMRQSPEPLQPAFEEARASLFRALKGQPAFAKAHAALGKLYLRENNSAEALKYLRRAAELDASDRMTLNQLVLALRREKREAEAAVATRRLNELVQADLRKDLSRYRVRIVKAPEDSPDPALPQN